MLTQKQIDYPGGCWPPKNKPIQIMNPEPGNGWGCIPAVDLIRMVRREAEKKDITVTQAKSLAQIASCWLLILIVVVFGIGMLLSLVK